MAAGGRLSFAVMLAGQKEGPFGDGFALRMDCGGVVESRRCNRVRSGSGFTFAGQVWRRRLYAQGLVGRCFPPIGRGLFGIRGSHRLQGGLWAGASNHGEMLQSTGGGQHNIHCSRPQQQRRQSECCERGAGSSTMNGRRRAAEFRR